MATTTAALDIRRNREKGSARSFNVKLVIDAILPQFDSMMKTYVVFNAFFLFVGVLEFIFLVVFFTSLAQSAILATSLALVFLTFFSYFILRLYLQAKQPEQYQEIRERYRNACVNLIQYQEGVPEHYVALSDAFTKFSEHLENRQYSFYNLPSWLSSFSRLVNKFSAWCHEDDVHHMQEILLSSAIEENHKLVRCAPISQAAHASLANAYMALAVLYKERALLSSDKESLIADESASEDNKKFQSASEKAIEEYKIIIDLSPGDPWAHSQLAVLYRELRMPNEEIQEYEIILKLVPDDKDALCRLGKLYFLQGKNGLGLRTYEQLKRNQDRRAEELIKFYGITNG